MSEKLRYGVSRYISLRGSGPYDDATMMEAALLIEEIADVLIPEEQLHSGNLGNADCLIRFASSLEAVG